MTNLAKDNNGGHIQALRLGTAQTVAVTASSAASAAFQASTVVVRLTPDRDCFVALGASPTASASTGHYLCEGVTEYFRVNPGERLAVVRAGEWDGNLFVSEMT